MIIVRYRGGLGNQMFQYAFQISLEGIYGKENVRADLSHYRLNREHNGYELGKVFGIRIQTASDREIRRLSPYFVPADGFEKIPAGIRNRISPKLQYYVPKLKREKNGYYRQEYHSSYEPNVYRLEIGKSWYLDGLWQDLRYFEEYQDEVRNVFSLKNVRELSKEDEKILNEIENSDSVGVHVRRGDFVNSKFDICSLGYYRAAIEVIERRVKNPRYFFFSDDPDFVEKEFADIEVKKVLRHDTDHSYVDLKMLSVCRHAILSNSTFAFWGAWLGNREDRTVIAPKYSLINQGRRYELRVPEGWIQDV